MSSDTLFDVTALAAIVIYGIKRIGQALLRAHWQRAMRREDEEAEKHRRRMQAVRDFYETRRQLAAREASELPSNPKLPIVGRTGTRLGVINGGRRDG